MLTCIRVCMMSLDRRQQESDRGAARVRGHCRAGNASVAVWCSVLQCGAVCGSGAVWKANGLPLRGHYRAGNASVVVWCSVVQCVTVCCSLLQCIAVWKVNGLSKSWTKQGWECKCCSVLQCVAACCTVLQCVMQCVEVCCSVLQCGAVWYSVVQCGK